MTNPHLSNVADALLISVQLATVTTVLLLLIGLPLTWWLARQRGWLKQGVITLISLPLVLPPTVLGFYTLTAIAPQSMLGQMYYALVGQQLAFSFNALVLGSVLFSLPFVMLPLVHAFTQLGVQYDRQYRSLGLSPWVRFTRCILPACQPAIATAIILGFSHTLGEFGVILMLGGSIPGQTQVLSIALYQEVMLFNYAEAHMLALVMLGFSVLFMAMLSRLSERPARVAN